MRIPEHVYRTLKNLLPQNVRSDLWMMLEAMPHASVKKHYSQFGEDAFLQGYFARKAWLKDMNSANLIFAQPRMQAGFYVDVGAFSPKRFSNTYWFYKRGWRGINIDATPGSMRAFKVLRPRDTNIEAAISNKETELIFHLFGTSHVVNTVSLEQAQQIIDRHGIPPREIRVKATRLEKVLDNHLPNGQSISFFSIDAEGHDLQVLESNNWDKYRPELVVVENNGHSIDMITRSDITALMIKVGYMICSWIRPSVVYQDKQQFIS